MRCMRKGGDCPEWKITLKEDQVSMPEVLDQASLPQNEVLQTEYDSEVGRATKTVRSEMSYMVGLRLRESCLLAPSSRGARVHAT